MTPAAETKRRQWIIDRVAEIAASREGFTVQDGREWAAFFSSVMQNGCEARGEVVPMLKEVCT